MRGSIKKYLGIIAISAIPISLGTIWALGRAMSQGNGSGNGNGGGQLEDVQIAIRDRSSRGSGTFGNHVIKKNDDLATEYNTFQIKLDTDYPLVVTDRDITLDLVTLNSDGSIQKWVVENPFPVEILLDAVNKGEKFSQNFLEGTYTVRLVRKQV